MFKKSDYVIASKELDVAHSTIDRLEQRIVQLSSSIEQSTIEIQGGEQRIEGLVREDVANPGIDDELRRIDAQIQAVRQWMNRQQQMRQAASLELAQAKLAVVSIEGRILVAQSDHYRSVSTHAFDAVWGALRKVLPAAMRDAHAKHVINGLVAARHGRAGGTPISFVSLWNELGRAIAERAKSEGVELIAKAAQNSKDAPPMTSVLSDRLSRIERRALQILPTGLSTAPDQFIAEIERITALEAPKLNTAADCLDYVRYWEGKVADYEGILSSLKSGTYAAPAGNSDRFDGHGWTTDERRSAESRTKDVERRTAEIGDRLQHARACLVSWQEAYRAARERENPATTTVH